MECLHYFRLHGIRSYISFPALRWFLCYRKQSLKKKNRQRSQSFTNLDEHGAENFKNSAPHSNNALIGLSPDGSQKTEQQGPRKNSLPVSFKKEDPIAPDNIALSGSASHRSSQSFDDRNSILNGILIIWPISWSDMYSSMNYDSDSPSMYHTLMHYEICLRCRLWPAYKSKYQHSRPRYCKG